MNGVFGKFFLALVLMFAPGSVFGATWYVAPNGIGSGATWSDATNIHDAVNNAASGDTILLSEGSFNLQVPVLINRDVRLRGRGIGVTILDCLAISPGPCVQITAPVSSATVIAEFTLTAATYGIAIDNASPVLNGLELRESEFALDIELSAATIRQNLFVDNMSDLEITDSRAQVTDNTFDGRGNTLCIHELSFFAVSANVFRRNALSGCSWAVRILEYGPEIRSLYSQNVITDSTYGIWTYTASSPRFLNNLVHGNDVGIEMKYSGGVVAYNTFADNYFDNADIDDSDVLFVNNTLTGSTWYGLSTGSTRWGRMSFGYNNVYGNRYDYDSTPDYIDLGGNISVDPQFVSGGYELESASPLIGQAAPWLYRVDWDILGNPREYDVTGEERPDIGAYEYTP